MKLISTAILIIALSAGLQAQTAPDAAELNRLLKEFLEGASRNDAAIHDRFWAEDLIYTGSAGRRIGKADIMQGQREAQPARAAESATKYSGEDVRIQQYGTTAIVAFRLVGITTRGNRTETANYLNTGTFLKRNGKWQVVSWQSTRMPRGDAESKTEVAATENALHSALLSGDAKTLEALLDESFIWTHSDGQQTTRQRLLDDLRSGRLKYSKLETNNVTVSAYGDTAIVRGMSRWQRSAIPGASSGDASPFTAFFTLTFVNRGGVWKAVAVHSSRE